jgi:hypothetical protein
MPQANDAAGIPKSLGHAATGLTRASDHKRHFRKMSRKRTHLVLSSRAFQCRPTNVGPTAAGEFGQTSAAPWATGIDEVVQAM